MSGDAITGVVWAICLAGILAGIFLSYRRSRLRAKRFLVTELFKKYFQGDMPANQLGWRTRQIVSNRFTGSSQFYSLAVAAFQSAVNANFAPQPPSEERERKLLKLLAGLKNEFGLPERYRIEGWRAGRE
jgi:hypothetical protein